jgi:glycosyltransferase involved in cell wall biosynthesis
LDPRIPITIYLPSFAGGGAENALARLANFWAAEGRSVRFVVNAATGPVAARLQPGIEVVDLGIDNPARALPGLLAWMAKARPPLVATALMSANVTGAFAARLRSPGTAMVALIRNHISAEILGKAPLKRMLGGAPLRWAYRQADAIGCVSSSVADDIVAYAGVDRRKVFVTYNPLPERGEAAPPEAWPGLERPVVITVGRLETQKDHATLLDAFAKLRATRAATLAIVGSGSLRPEIDARIARLGIAGSVVLYDYRGDIAACIAGSDLLVLSSRYEGLPNVVLEALGAGVTVAATDAPGGSAELLEDGRLGYLCAVGDVDGLARAMADGLERPVDPALLRARAAEFKIGNVARRYEAAFAAAIEAHG